MARWFVNPGTYREIAMTNPRHHRRHHRRWRYRRNPTGVLAPVTDAFHRPGQTIANGALGIASAYMTVALPNMLLPFPGTDIMSKVLRMVTRLAAGGLVVMAGRKMSPHAAQSIVTGASIGAVGSTVLDLFNTTMILGKGDTGQTPMTLFSSITMPTLGMTGMGAYTTAYPGGYGRPMGAYVHTAAMPMGRGGLTGPMQMLQVGNSRHSLW